MMQMVATAPLMKEKREKEKRFSYLMSLQRKTATYLRGGLLNLKLKQNISLETALHLILIQLYMLFGIRYVQNAMVTDH